MHEIKNALVLLGWLVPSRATLCFKYYKKRFKKVLTTKLLADTVYVKNIQEKIKQSTDYDFDNNEL